jgi:hypothetical protein
MSLSLMQDIYGSQESMQLFDQMSYSAAIARELKSEQEARKTQAQAVNIDEQSHDTAQAELYIQATRV